MHREESEYILASILVDKFLENRVDIDFVGVSLFCDIKDRRWVDPRVI